MEASDGRPEVLCPLLRSEAASQAVATLAEVLEDPLIGTWCPEERLLEAAWAAFQTEVDP